MSISRCCWAWASVFVNWMLCFVVDAVAAADDGGEEAEVWRLEDKDDEREARVESLETLRRWKGVGLVAASSLPVVLVGPWLSVWRRISQVISVEVRLLGSGASQLWLRICWISSSVRILCSGDWLRRLSVVLVDADDFGGRGVPMGGCCFPLNLPASVEEAKADGTSLGFFRCCFVAGRGWLAISSGPGRQTDCSRNGTKAVKFGRLLKLLVEFEREVGVTEAGINEGLARAPGVARRFCGRNPGASESTLLPLFAADNLSEVTGSIPDCSWAVHQTSNSVVAEACLSAGNWNCCSCSLMGVLFLLLLESGVD